MATLVCFVLMLAMVGVSEGAWCVCRSDVSDGALQKTLDYACGAGADCKTIQQGGACFNPNTVRSHCSYAANSYYQGKGQTQQACDFSGTATLTNSDPGGNGCTYTASASSAGSNNTPTSSSGSSSSNNTPTSSNNTPGSSSSTTGGGSTTPNTLTPTTGSSTGGVLGGLGPSGNGISSTDTSDAATTTSSFSFSLCMASLLVVFVLSAVI